MYALKFTGITDYLHLVKSERLFLWKIFSRKRILFMPAEKSGILDWKNN